MKYPLFAMLVACLVSAGCPKQPGPELQVVPDIAARRASFVQANAEFRYAQVRPR